MTGKKRVQRTWILLSAFILLAPAGTAGAGEAGDILESSGLGGGLIVHVGCGDGRLTAALCPGDGYLVLGLDTDPTNVAKARQHLRSQGLDAGKVTVDRFDGKRLPLVDNLVNLVVAEDLGDVAIEEVMRVLCPGGVACVKQDARWKKTVKPRPEGIDDWGHFLHGPDGNAVARDAVVDVPYHVQWIGAPEHSRDHEIATSMDVMVSAGGRIFYILDEGSTALPYYLPSRWHLVARDAFNGIVLWRRPLAEWRPYQVGGRTSLAADLWRRLVATQSAVYVTETIFGPVVCLNPKSGEVVRTYEGTEKTEEIVCAGGILYLVATTLEPEDVDRRQLAVRRITPDRKRIMAVEADTGKIVWTKEDDDTEGVQPTTLAVKGKRLFFQNTRHVVCLEAGTGRELWRYARPSPYARPGNSPPTLVACDDVVLSADRAARPAGGPASAQKGRARVPGELIALSADDGRELWRCPCGENCASPVDVFVAGGLVWVGEHPGRNASDYHHGRDLHTGEIKKTFDHTANWPTWHHHRCYRDKATERYILAGRTGIEFVDLESGDLITHHWVRGICEYGIMPCNGLIYSPPDQCACYIESKLHGFFALAPARGEGLGTRNEEEGTREAMGDRLEKGSVHQVLTPDPSSLTPSSDWPTFRHDNARSSHTPGEIPLRLKPAWNTRLGGKLTSLVGAEGRLFVARPETHTVFCLDALSGKVLWSYQAGGRVDSPPSLSKGIAVFGCHDGWVYALRTSDGALAWRFRAAPEDLRLVERNQVASVWPVHGSVLIEQGSVYFAAGRSSCLDGGMHLYRLDLATGEPLARKTYSSRDPKTGQYVPLFTPFEAELLPDRELPGLLPDVLSADAENLYLRSVALGRDLAIRDKAYVHHLFGSMGFLEDTWWERTYWIYGSHFYGGARGHGYAKTLFPGGRILTFDEDSVYGYRDASLDAPLAGIFRVAKNPEFIDLKETIRRVKPRKKRPGSAGHDKVLEGEELARRLSKFVWKDGMPQDPKAMNLTSHGGLGETVRRVTKYEYAWHHDVPLYPQAMLLTDKTFHVAGPPKFDEDATAWRLSTSRTDRFELDPLLKDAVDTFEGKKGGLVLAVDKRTGQTLGECRIPSSPVFDGMIAAGGKLFLALTDGSVLCLAGE